MREANLVGEDGGIAGHQHEPNYTGVGCLRAARRRVRIS